MKKGNSKIAYSLEVAKYLRQSFSRNDFLSQCALYQFGFVDERGNEEVTPKMGKLLRPTILLLTVDALNPGSWLSSVPAAAALEIFHNATLLIDDWQDGDEKRRGRKAIWTLPSVGPRQTVNIGLFLFTLSSKLFASLDSDIFSSEVRTSVQLLFEDTKMNVIRGQQMDIAYEEKSFLSLSDYLIMIELKTARLIESSLLLGALLGQAQKDVYNSLSQFGNHLGLLFQMQDDYLGVYGNILAMGKPADDIVHKKKSLPVILAMESSTGEEKKILQNLYSQKDMLDENDITTIKNIFEKLSIEKKTRELIETTYQKACNALSEISESIFTKKNDLLSLADLFAHRDK